MPKPTRTRPLSAAQVHDYVRKAEEFAESAASELGAERYIAATSLAIHAAINAADAVCGARIGQRAAGQRHDEVVSLLQDAGTDGIAVAKDLRRLLPLKTQTEYEPNAVAKGLAHLAETRKAIARSFAHSVDLAAVADAHQKIQLAAENLSLRPLFLAFVKWSPDSGEPLPERFARHVTAHAVGHAGVFNSSSALVAVMLATSLTVQYSPSAME